MFSISDVEYAILETSGRLSLLLKSSKRPPNIEDFQDIDILAGDVIVPRNVIIDGDIDYDELDLSDFDETILISQIKNMGYNSVKRYIHLHSISKYYLVYSAKGEYII